MNAGTINKNIDKALNKTPEIIIPDYQDSTTSQENHLKNIYAYICQFSTYICFISNKIEFRINFKKIKIKLEQNKKRFLKNFEIILGSLSYQML